MRLRWGTGIASRGKFTGADKPLEESIPARPKGRRRDLEKKRRLEQEQQNGKSDDVSTGIGPREEVAESTTSQLEGIPTAEGPNPPPSSWQRSSSHDDLLFQECTYYSPPDCLFLLA